MTQQEADLIKKQETIPPAPFSEDELSYAVRIDRISDRAEKNGWNDAVLEIYDRMKEGELTSLDVLKMFKK